MDRINIQDYQNMINSGIENQNHSQIKQLKEMVKRYEKALIFYADETKYHYAKKDHPHTRLAEDGGEKARKALSDKH